MPVTTATELPPTSAQRDARLDALKGVALALVLLWHLRPLTYAVTEPNLFTALFRLLVNGFYWDITLLGVPIFFMVSLRLYYARREQGAAYFPRRIAWLLAIFVFWTAVQWAVASVVYGGVPGFSWWSIHQGGPDLPQVDGSVFYYLFDLLFLVMLAEGLLRIPEAVRRVVLVLLGVVVPVFVFTGLELAGISLHHSLLVCFVPYVSAAYVWVRWPEYFTRLRWWFTALWLVAVCVEQIVYRLWQVNAFGGPAYARAGIVFGSLAVCAWVTGPAARLGEVVPRCLARYSLGVFALHKYFQLVMLSVVPEWGVAVAGLWLNLRYLAVFLPALALTAIAVALLAHSPLRRFVS